MKLSKSASGILSARYRIVLIKCFLANLILLPLPAAAEDVTINDGVYIGESFRGENITIKGGTFSGSSSFNAFTNLNILGGKFDSQGNGWFNISGKNMTIDSDNADFSLKNSDGDTPEIEVENTVITGNRGIFLQDIMFDSKVTSGKIIASKNTLLGGFVWTDADYNRIGNSIVRGALDIEQQSDALVNNANVVLNDSSAAGLGYYTYNYMADLTGNINEDAPETVIQLRDKISDNEINSSISFIISDLKRIDSTTKNVNDLADCTTVPVDIFSETWRKDLSLETIGWEVIEQKLRQHYADFNTRLGETGADVNISNSKFVLNDNAKLINDSFKSGDMTITASTVTVNGSNELSARSGKVQFVGSVLDVADNAVLTFSSADGALHLDGGSTLSLSGKMTGGVAAENGATIAIQSSAARLNGTLSGSADVNFNADYALSNLSLADDFQFRNIFIDSGKTLDIGTNRLTAASISGGTISAVLTDAAETTPIITADAKNVTIKLGMSAASNTKTTRYLITKGSGFNLGNYSTTRYAVSSTYFAPADAAKVGALTNWNGGDLYILRLSGSAAPIIDDLENNGVKVDPVFEKAAQILDLDDKYLEKLTDKQLDALDTVDDLLTEFDGDSKNTHQILREVAPDLSHSDMRSAEANALNLLNIVGLRFSTPAAAQRRGYNGGYYNRYYGYGRSGGDYAVGEGSLWAQGMINRVKSTAEQPFTANSGGFAAGVEVNAAEYFKFGFGYAYTDTNIKSERSKNNVETHSGFVYGHLQPQRAYFNFIAAFGHSRYKDTTKLAQLKSYYYADSVSAQIALGYTSLLTPEIGLRYMNVHQSTFEDALGAKSKAKDVSTLTGTGGLKLSHRYRLRANPQTAFIPELKAAATYDLARNRNDVAVLLPNGAAYTVKGESLKRFGVEAGAGLTISFGNDAELSLSYDGKFKPDYQDHTGMVNLKVKF